MREHPSSNVWRRVGAGNREALERLRARRLRLAVVSNSEGTSKPMLEEVGLRELLRDRHRLVRRRLGQKPDARIFRIALERLGVAPAEALMVGDSPTADVDGAQAVGIRAALIDPYDLYPWSRRRASRSPSRLSSSWRTQSARSAADEAGSAEPASLRGDRGLAPSRSERGER